MSIAPHLFDGVVQRQLLLLKLMHEYENRPYFGTAFQNDPDSPARQWIARVRALLRREGLNHSVPFEAAWRTAAQFWSSSVRSMCGAVIDAIESLKLELELSGDDDIGRIYDKRSQHGFYQDLSRILENAASDVLLIDPYFDEKCLSLYCPRSQAVQMRVLCSKSAGAVQHVAEMLSAERGLRITVRKSRDLHDRVLILDRRDCWVLGASIKDGGKKPTYLLPLQPDLCAAKVRIYESIFEVASAAQYD